MTCYRRKSTIWPGKYRHHLTLGRSGGQTVDARSTSGVPLKSCKGFFSRMYLETTSMVAWEVALITAEMLLPWMCWYVLFEVIPLCEEVHWLQLNGFSPECMSNWACASWGNLSLCRKSCRVCNILMQDPNPKCRHFGILWQFVAIWHFYQKV